MGNSWQSAVLLVATALAGVTSTRSALAKPSKEVAACYNDFERSQELRREHRLSEARAALSHCALPVCPVAVSRPCEKWLAEVDKAIPTVDVRAETAKGEPIKEGTLSIDGTVRGDLPQTGFALDPGEHTFVLRLNGETIARATLVLAEGDKNREVRLRGALPEKEPPPPPSSVVAPPSADRPRRGLSAGPIALFATSAVGLGVFSVVGLGARSDAADLRSRCSPRCPKSEVDPLRTRALVADIGLGVSALTAAAGLYLALSRPSPAQTALSKALSRIVASPNTIGLVTTHTF